MMNQTEIKASPDDDGYTVISFKVRVAPERLTGILKKVARIIDEESNVNASPSYTEYDDNYYGGWILK